MMYRPLHGFATIVDCGAPHRLQAAGWYTTYARAFYHWSMWHPTLGTVDFEIVDTLDAVRAVINSGDLPQVVALVECRGALRIA